MLTSAFKSLEILQSTLPWLFVNMYNGLCGDFVY